MTTSESGAVARTAIPLNRRAAHLIRIKTPELAESVVAQQYRRHPELAVRYGEPGRHHCLKDAGYHLSFLASSVEFGDPRIFADYIAWTVELLARRSIPARDVTDNVVALGRVLEDTLPQDLLPLLRPHVEAALHRADQTTGSTDSVSRPDARHR